MIHRLAVFGVTFVYFYKEMPDDGRMAETCCMSM